jgi:hypothetical protein
MWLTGTLDINEVDVVGGSVDHSPKCHRISHLPVEPDVLIGREQPSKLGPHDTDYVSQHGDEDHPSVKSKYESCSTGTPYRELETIESSQFLIGCLHSIPISEGGTKRKYKWQVMTSAYLTPPTVGKEKQLYAIPYDIEG